jgi:hypothetical protein
LIWSPEWYLVMNTDIKFLVMQYSTLPCYLRIPSTLQLFLYENWSWIKRDFNYTRYCGKHISQWLDSPLRA